MLCIDGTVKGEVETNEPIRPRSRRGEGTHELSMNVTTDGDWAPNWLYVGFFHQDLPRLLMSVSANRGGVDGSRTRTNLVAEFLYICFC